MKSIKVNNEGKYVWGYELDLFKNFVVLKLILKVFSLILFAEIVFSCLLSIINGNLLSDLFEITKLLIILIVVMLVISFVGYFIYAKIMGGKYCVVFEMDENGVKHTQLDKQTNKANMLSLIETLAGVATKNPGRIGAGLMKYGRSSLYTDFKRVKKIKTDRNSNTIILKYGLHNNQVYVEDDDYDEILAFIESNCPIRK